MFHPLSRVGTGVFLAGKLQFPNWIWFRQQVLAYDLDYFSYTGSCSECPIVLEINQDKLQKFGLWSVLALNRREPTKHNPVR
jgi:hypothetical protein